MYADITETHTHLHSQNWNCFVLTSTVWNKICALKQFGHMNRSWNLWHLSVTAHSKGHSVYERRGLISCFAFKYTAHHLFMLCEKIEAPPFLYLSNAPADCSHILHLIISPTFRTILSHFLVHFYLSSWIKMLQLNWIIAFISWSVTD